jgi:hypothetical protein
MAADHHSFDPTLQIQPERKKQDMDTEQTSQLFTQSRLRCLVLEADRDAESLKADKYRKILDTVINEGRPDVAESHGQAACASHAARDASVRISVAYCRPYCVPTILETS